MLTGASIALIFLIIETMFAAFMILVVCTAMVYGLHKLRQLIVRFMPKAQAFTQRVADITHMVSDKIAQPLMAANGGVAHVYGTAKAAKRRMTR
ncbi:MAG TPA: hypothetical protein VGK87_16285 [Anaerolineae bacterium]